MKGSSFVSHSKRRKTTPSSLSPSGNAAAKAARISSPLSHHRTQMRSVRARTSNAGAEQNMNLPDAGGDDDDKIYYGCDDDVDEMYEDDDFAAVGGQNGFVVSKYFETCVKVFCIHTEPNFSLPWQRKRQFASTSSGFVIADRRILTNAHSVEYSTQVKVKRHGSDVKYVARVLAIGIECDVAMLAVDDEEFWQCSSNDGGGGGGQTEDERKGHLYLELGDLPFLQDKVTVVGYPIGGETVSVTQGVVSRVEVSSYAHGACDLLAVQIDAAINSGNSGGPALNDNGECVGIAFQSMKHDEAENIGYIIPTPVIRHFIRDFEVNGTYTGFPSLGLLWQKLENPTMREALGLNTAIAALASSSNGTGKSSSKSKTRGRGGSRSTGKAGVVASNIMPTTTGVYIRSVATTSSVTNEISSGDVLLSFDGQRIANDGTVPFGGRSGERINWSFLVSQKYIGDSVPIEVLRGRRKTDVNGETGDDTSAQKKPLSSADEPPRIETTQVTLGQFRRLIPVHVNEKPPSYLIVGGIVFVPVTVPFLKSEYGKEYDYESPVQILHKMYHGLAETSDESVVVLSQVLVSDITVGYEDVINTKVLTFNGTKVKNLRSLSKLVSECQDEFLRFHLEDSRLIVLRREQAMKATEEVLKTHCIARDRSDDLCV